MKPKKTLTVFLSAMLLILITCITCETSNAQSITQEINNFENTLLPPILVSNEPVKKFNLLDRMKHHNIPGVSIAVVKNGKLHWAKGYGKRTAGKEALVDDKTLFQAASVTKPFAALGVLKLVEKGEIKLDVNVNNYLKDWQIPNNEFTKKEKVTVRRLLSHTAGISGHGFDGYPQTENIPTTIEVLNGEGNSRSVVVDNIPGEVWRYSGGGYVILQKLIEDVTGLPFDVYMNTEILEPLHMTSSTFQQPLDRTIYKNVSSAHTNDGKVVVGDWHNYPEKGAGGLWSTPTDIAKYCIEIQNIMAGKESVLLKKETIEQMLTKGLNNWGLGVRIDGEGDSLRFAHDGKNEGFFADFLAFAHKGSAVVILTNGNTGTLVKELLKSISNTYNWDTHHQRTVDVVAVSSEKLADYTGRYLWTDRPSSNWIIELVLQDEKLHFIASGFPTNILTPQGNNRFIDIETEVEVHFKTSDLGIINGLTWRGRFNFEKVN
ncbi:CubicO group peptidase (beta-lactamase class C family) [Saonia flava]|uniref:CubicO group peptidase (Beta-lactamase class C family) n=1 Tax=Saonia flava TaxID=523696 RepID=A0A846QYN1_9FLAO|nr:serine hydrolase domain-containing protein [Saonia flava]NJB72317.1 CubicO group peptidase (beta-lactamase class C family) [Saonia flava]